MVITGLEKLLSGSNLDLLQKQIGLIVNHTSVDSNLKLSLDKLVSIGYNIRAIFAPEHGFRGDAVAGEKVSHQIDQKTGIKVYSLYGESKKPTSEMLAEIDTFIFDIQDIGVRYYTYIYTMAYSMEAAAEHGIDFYVLDRPNPISGACVEGNIIDCKFDSFVGQYGLPMRHGMTVGELAHYVNSEYKIGCNLIVVKMDGWKRQMCYDETELHWVMPSPNATGITMAALYPGTCLFEGTNVSEGRGTTRPFEIIGAPWVDGEKWCESLLEYRLDGVLFRPTQFTPTSSKYEGENCKGLQVHIVDRGLLKPIQVAFAMIESLKKLYPADFKWVDPIKGRYFIDLLAGTDQLRSKIDNNESIIDWLAVEEAELESFKAVREKYVLY